MKKLEIKIDGAKWILVRQGHAHHPAGRPPILTWCVLIYVVTFPRTASAIHLMFANQVSHRGGDLLPDQELPPAQSRPVPSSEGRQRPE